MLDAEGDSGAALGETSGMFHVKHSFAYWKERAWRATSTPRRR